MAVRRTWGVWHTTGVRPKRYGRQQGSVADKKKKIENKNKIEYGR